MSSWRSLLFTDPLVPGVLAFLLGLFLLSWWIVWCTRRRLTAEARWVATEGTLLLRGKTSTTPPHPGERRALTRLRSLILRAEPKRLIVVSSPREPLERFFADELESDWGAWIGSVFTGIALIFTFGLIAFVLLRDVGPAILAALTEEAKSMSQLSKAVGLMGAKFIISCAGILFAILNQALVRWELAAARRDCAESIDIICALCVSADALRLEHLETLLARSEAQQGRLSEEFARVHQALTGLRIIEVSVKDLGAEVSDKLGRVVTDALAQQMSESVAQMRSALEQIDGNLAGELVAIRTVLESQANSQVEQLLGKLQDAVTGGFTSETKNIEHQIRNFGEVIPTIASGLNQVVARLETVLASNQEATSSLIEATSALVHGSQDQIRNLGEELAKQGGATVEATLGTSLRQVDELVTTLKERTGELLRGIDASTSATANRAESTSAAFAQAAATTAKTLTQTTAVAQSLQTLLGQVKATLEEGARSGKAFDKAGTTLVDVVTRLEQTGQRLSTALDQQQRILDQMQQVWPALLGTVAQRVQEMTQRLAGTWELVGERLQKATTESASRFADAVDDLSENLEEIRGTRPPTSPRK